MRRTHRVPWKTARNVAKSVTSLALGVVVLTAAGCGGAYGPPSGGGYDGATADARITPENAASLAAVALGLGTGLDAFVGRPTVAAAKAGEPGPFVPPAVAKAVREVYGGENAAVIPFDYDVPGPAGGNMRVYGSLWLDGTGTLATAFDGYGRGDGTTLDGTVTYLIDERDPATGRITRMGIRLAAFRTEDAAHALRLDGRIDVSAPTPGEVVNVLDLEGTDAARGKGFRYHDFVLVRATSPGADPAEDLTGVAYDGASGRLTVVSDAPVTWDGATPSGGGPVRLFGADGTAARVTPRGDGTAEVAVDGDGDGAFETVTALPWDQVE